MPGELPLQFSHDPLQALLQQTVSAQLPLRHSGPALHDCAIFFLQAPLALQVYAPVQLSGSSILVTATQVPPGLEQDWHVPQDATLQQWSSTQNPLLHWLAVALEQALPRLKPLARSAGASLPSVTM